MMHDSTVEKASFWGGRVLLYLVLTSVAVLLMFPLIYMVSASLKTTVDYNSNPRRLLPYTHLTTEFNGQSVPMYSFEINGAEETYLTAQIDANNNDSVDFAFIGTQSNLEEQLQLGIHADQRRTIDVLAIIPLEYITPEGDDVDLDEGTFALVQTDTQTLLAGNDGTRRSYQVYQVLQDERPLSTYLESTQSEVPLHAYIIADSALQAERIEITFGEEIALFDAEQDDRDYDLVDFATSEGHNQTLVWAYNSSIGVFVKADDPSQAIFAIERFVKPIEEVDFQFGNYDTVLGRDEENQDFRLDRALVNTALVTILVTLGQIATSLFGGYAFSRIPFRGRDTLFLVYLGSIMVPFVVLIVPIFRLMVALGWDNHLVSLIVPWIFTAYGTFLIRQFFLSIPREIEEAALLDGCSRFRILWKIFIPLSTPAIATHAIFTFLYAWNSFLWPLIIINTGNKDDHVLTLALITLANINADKPNLVMTGAAVMILPPMIVFVLAQKYFIEGIATSGLKG